MTRTPAATVLRRAAAALALPLAVLAGCESSGLSPREAADRTFSSYVYALDPAPAADTQPARLVLPTRLAVAQMGEVTPPSSFLSKLRTQPALFSRVEGISGAIGVDPRIYRRPGDSTITADSQARSEMARIQRVARDMGMDHLLLVGGTIDRVAKENGLSVLDLTIVGAFVVPSKQVDAEAKAAGALIDLASGRVLLIASADASKGRLASTATQGSAEIDVMRGARDEVLDKLAGQVIEQCQRREQSQPAPGAT
jgi:rhombotail lipoprotein